MRWAHFHFDCKHIDIVNTSDFVVDDKGPFKVKSHTRALVSKDIASETFLATAEISYLIPIELVMSLKVTY